MSELLFLFSSAFLAATLLPAQSEAVLVALQLGGRHSPVALLGVATLGNVLGSCVNWLLGRYLLHFRDRRWFPANERQLERATRAYTRFGVWSLLLAWVPFIGDPLTVVAGLMQVRFALFAALVTVGKLARYAALMAAVGL